MDYYYAYDLANVHFFLSLLYFCTNVPVKRSHAWGILFVQQVSQLKLHITFSLLMNFYDVFISYIFLDSASLNINCGGRSLGVGDKQYEGDEDPGRPSGFYSTKSRWGFSNTGHFLDDSKRGSYIVENTSRISMNNPDLYMTARSSALSLTYYGFCMHKGSYNVSLHFAEIVFTNDTTYRGLGRRLFDIYIQASSLKEIC